MIDSIGFIRESRRVRYMSYLGDTGGWQLPSADGIFGMKPRLADCHVSFATSRVSSVLSHSHSLSIFWSGLFSQSCTMFQNVALRLLRWRPVRENAYRTLGSSRPTNLPRCRPPVFIASQGDLDNARAGHLRANPVFTNLLESYSSAVDSAEVLCPVLGISRKRDKSPSLGSRNGRSNSSHWNWVRELVS
jgi:hypothetical protein